MARFWALVGLSLVMAGCGDEPPAQAPLPQPVKLYTVNGDGAGQLRHYPGRVVATEGSQLAFRVSGQLVKLPVRAGEQVKKGQLLAPDHELFEHILDRALVFSADGARSGYHTVPILFDQISTSLMRT